MRWDCASDSRSSRHGAAVDEGLRGGHALAVALDGTGFVGLLVAGWFGIGHAALEGFEGGDLDSDHGPLEVGEGGGCEVGGGVHGCAPRGVNVRGAKKKTRPLPFGAVRQGGARRSGRCAWAMFGLVGSMRRKKFWIVGIFGYAVVLLVRAEAEIEGVGEQA